MEEFKKMVAYFNNYKKNKPTSKIDYRSGKNSGKKIGRGKNKSPRGSSP
jgi:hypothetical protein